MLQPIKSRLHETELQEILSYSIFPDPDELDAVIAEYQTNDDLLIYGLESEDEIVGVIGVQIIEPQILIIRHIAVMPTCRGAGFGRGLILEVIELLKPLTIVAETDEEAVDFYRNIGFEIESLGEKYPGFERFKCLYIVGE